MMASAAPIATSGKANTAAQSQAIDLASLPSAQLNQVKNQLTQELQHLTTSFQQLKAAQAKFRDCGTSIKDGLKRGEGAPILVPLTTSLYVPGKLASTDTVLVDVGTGFFVEKTPEEATTFYRKKTEELGKNLVDLEKIVGGKQANLGVVEDVLRQKVILEQQQQQQQQRSKQQSGDGSTIASLEAK